MRKYNNNHNKKNPEAIYEKIMHQLAPEIRRALLEAEQPGINLAGASKNIGTADNNRVFTAMYIHEHAKEEIAEAYYQYSLYLMDKFNQNVDEAINNFFEMVKGEWKSIFASPDDQKKILDAIVISVKSAIMNKYDTSKKYAQAISCHIIFSVAWLIKISITKWDNADIALKWLYGSVASFLMQSYKAIAQKIGNDKEEAERKYVEMKDTISRYMSVANAIIIIIANDLKDAKNTFGVWVDKIAADAKAHKLFAVSIIRSWFAAENETIKEWVEETYNDSKKDAVTVWNDLSAPAIKAWNNALAKAQDFLNKAKATKENMSQKIKQFTEDTKTKAISIKDTNVSKIIQAAVKKLNKENYPLDRIIDMVTKAYNESISVKNGRIILNESRFNRHIARYLND